MTHPFIPLKTNLFQKIHNSLKLIVIVCKIRKKWKTLVPEHRKGFATVIGDMLYLIWKQDAKTKWFLIDYFNSHLWRKDCDIHEYVMWNEWLRLKQRIDVGEMVEILEHKGRSWAYFHQRGYPVTKRLGILSLENGSACCKRTDGRIQPLAELLKETGGVFVKPDDEMQGKGCARLTPSERAEQGCCINGVEADDKALTNLLRKPLHVEELIRQHPRIAAFHPQSINTLRLITMVKPEGGIELNRAVLRMGTGVRSTDNWCTGGLAVQIIGDGTLNRLGWFEEGSVPPTEAHPDTQVAFAGYEIPFYHEAVDLVLRAHGECKDTWGIGWDVAITSEGPILIESNVCFANFQPLCGGLRETMEKRLRPLAEAAEQSLSMSDR